MSRPAGWLTRLRWGSKRQLVLHVGLNKTGTSTIQHNLMANEASLRAAGFHLPDRLGRQDGGHHEVVTLFSKGGQPAFMKHLTRDNSAPVTVLSAENLTQLFRHRPQAAAAMAETLEPHFDTTVVLFLRRQDYLKESVFAQVAREYFQGTILEERGFIYDFVPFVDTLEGAFGRDRIRIVIYRDDRDFDSWECFCNLLGLRASDYPASPGNPNVSLPRRKTLALAMMPKRSRGVAKRVADIMAASTCIRDDGIRYLMSPEQRQTFLGRFLGGNRILCDRYAPEGAEFFCSDAMPSGPWFPADPISPEEWAAFTAELARVLTVPAGT